MYLCVFHRLTRIQMNTSKYAVNTCILVLALQYMYYQAEYMYLGKIHCDTHEYVYFIRTNTQEYMVKYI